MIAGLISQPVRLLLKGVFADEVGPGRLAGEAVDLAQGWGGVFLDICVRQAVEDPPDKLRSDRAILSKTAHRSFRRRKKSRFASLSMRAWRRRAPSNQPDERSALPRPAVRDGDQKDVKPFLHLVMRAERRGRQEDHQEDGFAEIAARCKTDQSDRGWRWQG